MHGRDELEALSFVGAESRFQSYGRDFCRSALDVLAPGGALFRFGERSNGRRCRTCPANFCALRVRALIALHMRAAQELDGSSALGGVGGKLRPGSRGVALGMRIQELRNDGHIE